MILQPPPPDSHPQTTILVVDDDPVIQQLVATVHYHAGWRVELANDSEVAWQKLAELAPNLIPCDVNMPHLNGYAILGGSNGFWKIEWLHAIRMHGRKLTEAIDASMRILAAGDRTRSDPGLINTELATTNWQSLWHQRMRWAQGWFQVSRRHLGPARRSAHLTRRQKLGMLHLLAWREEYPRISWQVLPLIAYWPWRGDRVTAQIPIGVLTTLFTISVGLLYAVLAYRLGYPSIRAQPSWFCTYFWTSGLPYTELKNLIIRISQIKDLSGERTWRITPRPPTTANLAKGDA